MIDHFVTNTIGPALILKHIRLLLDKKSSSIVSVLSARVGSIEDNKLGGWYSYRAAKAAVNQIVKSFSIELSRSHPKACLLAIHPGTVDTNLTQKYSSNYPKQTPAEAAQNILDVTLNKDTSHTGKFLIGLIRKSVVKPNLILVLGDQLTLDLAAIRQADKSKDV